MMAPPAPPPLELEDEGEEVDDVVFLSKKMIILITSKIKRSYFNLWAAPGIS
jgi:hypothetical protein